MKNWEIKRFCLFTSAEYEAGLGLDSLEHSTDTLPQMKKWLMENITDDALTFAEWWQIDDLKKGKTVLGHYEDDEFVKTLFQMRAIAHLKLVEKSEN